MSDESWNDVLEKTRRASSPSGEKVIGLHAVQADAALPSYADDYKAAAVQSNDSLTRLCCVMGREGFQPGGKAYRFFQYVHLDSDTDLQYSKDGQIVTLRFAGSKPVVITMRGRNLLRVCDYIHLHRIAWVRVADRDFTSADPGDHNRPIITAISIVEVEAENA